jgi:hypothetical protein
MICNVDVKHISLCFYKSLWSDLISFLSFDHFQLTFESGVQMLSLPYPRFLTLWLFLNLTRNGNKST